MALDNPSYFSVAVGSSPLNLTEPNTLTTTTFGVFKKPLLNNRMGSNLSNPTQSYNHNNMLPSSSDNLSTSSSTDSSNTRSPQQQQSLHVIKKHQHQESRTLRSVSSTTSADSNQELLIMGEPRASDIAPELQSSNANMFTYPATATSTRTNSNSSSNSSATTMSGGNHGGGGRGKDGSLKRREGRKGDGSSLNRKEVRQRQEVQYRQQEGQYRQQEVEQRQEVQQQQRREVEQRQLEVDLRREVEQRQDIANVNRDGLLFNRQKDRQQQQQQQHGGSNCMYSVLATSEEEDLDRDEVDEDEEVFLNEDSARYYNFSSVGQQGVVGSVSNGRIINQQQQQGGLRRHSIGTFMGRERTVSIASSCPTFKEDFPVVVTTSPRPSVVIDEHSLRHASYPRKRCLRCTKGQVKKSTNMDDILIISVKESKASSLWVEYFTTYFDRISRQANRKPIIVHHLGIEDIILSKGDISLLAERTSSVKLQLIIVCPALLEKIREFGSSIANLGKLLLADRILALLLGVTDSDVEDCHKTVLNSYTQWPRMEVGQDQDEHFTKEFLSKAMAIFSKVLKQQSTITSQDKSHFSLSPKKVRHGQSSILILLDYPLQKDDIVKVSIDRGVDSLQEILPIVRVRNPYTVKVAVPDSLLQVSALVTVVVEKNGSVLGRRPLKCESRLRQLEVLLRSVGGEPLDYLCQTLGFNPHEREPKLDNWMLHMFQKNLPPNFTLFTGSYIANEPKRCEQFPTLLHFAARFGLEKLCMQLVEVAGGDVACEIRNVDDQTPADIADSHGYGGLANTLRGYMKMNELTTMYTTLKAMNILQETTTTTGSSNSGNSNDAKKLPLIEDDGYLVPKRVEDFYKICPAPKPVVTSLSSTSTLSVTSSSTSPPQLYLSMQNNTFQKSASTPNSPQTTLDSINFLQNNNNHNNSHKSSTITESSSALKQSNGNNIHQTNSKSNQLITTLSGTKEEFPQKQQLQFQHPNNINNCLSSGLISASSPVLSLVSCSVATGSNNSNSIGLTTLANNANNAINGNNGNNNGNSGNNGNFNGNNGIIVEDKCEVELLEIINDCKNNVHSIAQAEKLVAEWQTRNDVQKSFREKQHQINEMRIKYELIQHEMKNSMKKSSSFDRIKRLLFGGGGAGNNNSHHLTSSRQTEDTVNVNTTSPLLLTTSSPSPFLTTSASASASPFLATSSATSAFLGSSSASSASPLFLSTLPSKRIPPVTVASSGGGGGVNTRPTSSLSLQSTCSSSSSSSSGGISGNHHVSGTNSVSSFGDSGTHSDHDDRKNVVLNANNEDDIRNLITFNYSIPPAPKPFKHFPIIEERSGWPTTLTSTSPSLPSTSTNPNQILDNLPYEHYIQFPPSNLPVIVNSTLSGCSTIPQPPPLEHYMNIITEEPSVTVTATATADLPTSRLFLEYMNFPSASAMATATTGSSNSNTSSRCQL